MKVTETDKRDASKSAQPQRYDNRDPESEFQPRIRVQGPLRGQDGLVGRNLGTIMCIVYCTTFVTVLLVLLFYFVSHMSKQKMSSSKKNSTAPATTMSTAAERFGGFFSFNQDHIIRVNRTRIQQAERNFEDLSKTPCMRVFIQFVNFVVLLIVIFGFALVAIALLDKKYFHPNKRDESFAKRMFALFGHR